MADFSSNPFFNPYKFMHTAPWMSPDAFTQNLYGSSTEFWRDYWKWVNFQHKALQEDLFESSRWLTHCMQLSSHPQTLYRYLRMHWQKPYIEIASQTFTSSRLMGQMWMDSWDCWQKMTTGQKPSH